MRQTIHYIKHKFKELVYKFESPLVSLVPLNASTMSQDFEPAENLLGSELF